MFFVYILKSETTGGYYCGHTADLAERLRQHNDPAYRSTRTTKRDPGPWTAAWQTEQPTRSAAMLLERKIKKQGIKRFLDRVHAQSVPPSVPRLHLHPSGLPLKTRKSYP